MKLQEDNKSRAIDGIAPICGALAFGLGLIVLLGWILRLPLLASFGADLIPMAPSAALVLVLYGAALFIKERFPAKSSSHVMALITVSLGLAIALPLFVLSYAGIHPQIEHLGMSPLGAFGDLPDGHMSPLTAICFVVIGVSSLSAFSTSAARVWRAWAAFWLAFIILIVSLVLLLAYVLGAPILYTSDVIPPALSTSVAFVVLALGLVVTTSQQLWPFREKGDTESARESFVLVLVFVLLAVGIVTSGYFYSKNYERNYRLGVEQQLSAIAQLKVAGLVAWRHERLGDGQVFSKNNVFSGIVKQYFQNRNDPGATTMIRTWVGQVQKAHNYDLVMLLDAQLNTKYAFPGNREPARLVIDQKAFEIILSGDVALQDFYRNDLDNRVYLKVLVPIMDDRSPNRLIGVLVFRIDPEKYLYPMIRQWPVPSLTSETLIIRREENDALFLNELRFQRNTALNLRISLSNSHVAAVKAVLGQEGIVDAIDYRGVPVVADVRAVPGSPWLLVTRTDVGEVYAPLRNRLWGLVGLIAVLLFGAAAGVGGVWRNQRARFYRQRYEAIEAFNASELRYRRLFEAAKDGILILDAESGMVVDVNPFLIELLGLSHEEFLTKKIWELGFFKDIAESKANFLELQEKKYIRYEDLPLETAAGEKIHVEFVSNIYQVDHQSVAQCNIRDISARKRAEAALRESEKDFRLLAEAIPQMVWITRPDGWNVYFNKRWVDYTGLTLEESYGDGWNKPFHPDDQQRAWDAWQDATKHGAVYSLDCRLRRADGVYRWWLIRGVPILDERGAILKWFGTCTDIDDLKQAEEEIQKLNAELESRILERTAQLEAANKELEAFAYSVSHDLRSPLRAIDGFSQIILDEYANKLDAEGNRLFNIIRSNTQKMGELITDMLNLSRVSRNEMKHSLVDMKALANSVYHEAASPEVRQKFSFSVGPIPDAFCDPALMKQVWKNLISNAIKFTMPEDERKIEIGGHPEGGMDVFFIKDSGVGFDSRYTHKLFGVFQRLHKAEEFEGTGVGLAIVQRIIHRHGGKVWAEGEVGEGATFWFSLPNRKEAIGNSQ